MLSQREDSFGHRPGHSNSPTGGERSRIVELKRHEDLDPLCAGNVGELAAFGRWDVCEPDTSIEGVGFGHEGGALQTDLLEVQCRALQPGVAGAVERLKYVTNESLPARVGLTVGSK